MLVDSHCHLDHAGLFNQQNDVLDRARVGGVGRFLNISTTQAEWPGVVATARRHADVFAAIGIHPHEADDHVHVGADEICDAAADSDVIALGESGLDYHYDRSDRARQRDNFRVHIEAARRTGLPLVIHTRDAEDDTANILAAELDKGPFGALIHCFTGTSAFGQRMVDLGLLISFSGVLTFRNADRLREFAATVPADRLLLETDSPFLAPVPHRGRVGEPAMVADTAAVLATVCGLSLDEVAAQTTDNFFRLFTRAC